MVEMSYARNVRADGRQIRPFTRQTAQIGRPDALREPGSLPKAMFQLEWIVFIQNTQD